MNPPIPLVCDAPCMTSPARCWLRRSCLIRKRLLREARRILGTNTSASGIRSLSEVGARCNGSGNAARVPPHGESLARIPRSVDHDSPISLLKRTRVPVTSTHFLSATVRCIQERNSHGHVLERRHSKSDTIHHANGVTRTEVSNSPQLTVTKALITEKVRMTAHVNMKSDLYFPYA